MCGGLHGGKLLHTCVAVMLLWGDLGFSFSRPPPPAAPLAPILLTSQPLYIPGLRRARGLRNYGCEILSSKWSISSSHIFPDTHWSLSTWVSLLSLLVAIKPVSLSFFFFQVCILTELFLWFFCHQLHLKWGQWNHLKFLGPQFTACASLPPLSSLCWPPVLCFLGGADNQ